MKRIFAFIICTAFLTCLLAGCGNEGGELSSSSKPELENIVDYSILGDPYGTICEFMINPTDYQGQNIKINALGSVIYNFEQNKVVKNIMLGLDSTGCCNASYEVRSKDGNYPVNGSNVTFVGTFTPDGYIDLYDWISDVKSEASYELDTLTMSADELTAFITEYTENYSTSASAGKKIRIFGHLLNYQGYPYLIGLTGEGLQTWIIELHDKTGTMSFPVVSGNLVNPVEVIGTLTFYLENDIPYACIEVEAVNKVECVFR
jgi:hypothetical protein